jgi:hypothetical protein
MPPCGDDPRGALRRTTAGPRTADSYQRFRWPPRTEEGALRRVSKQSEQ